eukprot:gene27196-32860_t
MSEIDRILKLFDGEDALRKAIADLREMATGYHLQGGQEQLERARELFHSIEAMLQSAQLAPFRDHAWFLYERGQAMAGIQHYDEAEACILRAMLRTAFGQHDGTERDRQLLRMANNL